MGVRWGYVTTGAPPTTAVAPLPAMTPAMISYKSAVAGQPGTQGVPAGLPDFGMNGLQANGVRLRGGGAGYNSGSDTMPLVWYPQLWYQRTLLNPGSRSSFAGGIRVWSDNQMPVPAASPLGVAAKLAMPPVFLGQRDIPQPPTGFRAPGWWQRLAQSAGFSGPGGHA